MKSSPKIRTPPKKNASMKYFFIFGFFLVIWKTERASFFLDQFAGISASIAGIFFRASHYPKGTRFLSMESLIWMPALCTAIWVPGQVPDAAVVGDGGERREHAHDPGRRSGPRVCPRKKGCSPKGAKAKKRKRSGHRAGSMPGHTREPQR